MKKIIKSAFITSALICSLAIQAQDEPYNVSFVSWTTIPLNVDYAICDCNSNCTDQPPIKLPSNNSYQNVQLPEACYQIVVADVKNNKGQIIGGPYESDTGISCYSKSPGTTLIFPEAANKIVCIMAGGLSGHTGHKK